jgi:type II secretory pathway predicted ATPase ExeA
MFLPEFGLAMQPFGISPRLEFLYKSGAFEESIAHLVYGLDNSEAIVMITGAIGTGKTMAIQSFLSYLGDRYVSALVTNTSVDSKELLKLVLEDLGHQAAPGSDKSDLLIAFKNLLVATGREGKRIVIVIDEAQNLSREVLEEVRLLTNLGQGDEQPVQIILVGQPELETAVQRPDLAQLKQRIRVHYKLAPLSRSELQQYVDHRMTVAGGEAGVFTNGALDRVYSLSGGVPRVVNTLCGEALLSAYVAGRRKVEAVDLDEHANKPAPAAPRDEPERVHVVKPEPEIQRREMAVRREPKPEPVRAEPPVVKQAAVPAKPARLPNRMALGGSGCRLGGDRGRLGGYRTVAVLLVALAFRWRLEQTKSDAGGAADSGKRSTFIRRSRRFNGSGGWGHDSCHGEGFRRWNGLGGG